MMMSSDYVLLGVAHRDRDLPQLGLSKSPVEPRSFALLVVLQDHSRRRRRSFFSFLEVDAWVVDGHSSAPVRSFGPIGRLYYVLAALTLVSDEARNSLPWLFQSVAH
jgi:hypothetical protein